MTTKQVDIATNNTESLSILKKKSPDKYEQVRINSKSTLIPSDSLVWRRNLPEDLKEKIREFVLSYGVKGPDVERQRQVLAGMSSGWSPMRPSDNSQLIPIRQLSLYREKLKIESDDKLSTQKKEAKLSDLEAKLRDLQARLEKKTQQ